MLKLVRISRPRRFVQITFRYTRARVHVYKHECNIIIYTYMILYTRLMRNNSVNVFISQRLVYIIYLAAAMVSGGCSGGDGDGDGECI